MAKSIINAPEGFFNNFESGKTRVSVHASGVRKHAIDITVGSGMIVTDVSSRTNMSSDRNSNFILAVIRVSDKYNHSPDSTAAQISNSIFGTGGAPLNVVRDICFDFYSRSWFVLLKCHFCTLSLITSRNDLLLL